MIEGAPSSRPYFREKYNVLMPLLCIPAYVKKQTDGSKKTQNNNKILIRKESHIGCSRSVVIIQKIYNYGLHRRGGLVNLWYGTGMIYSCEQTILIKSLLCSVLYTVRGVSLVI